MVLLLPDSEANFAVLGRKPCGAFGHFPDIGYNIGPTFFRCSPSDPAVHFPAQLKWLFATITVFLSLAIGRPTSAEDSLPAESLDFFESKIRPLLINHCYECHSLESGEASGGLRLDSATASHAGGSHGAAVVPGDLSASTLVKAIEYDDPELQMPPEGKLQAEQIELLKHWIEIGAPDPREETAPKTVSPLERDPSTHWAFVAPQRSAPSATNVPLATSNTNARDGISRDDIDEWSTHFATEIGLDIADEATPQTLLRRLYFDLTGLPPSIEAIQRFANSSRPDAYTRLVDELLVTPEFAERFARHWLDVARYADTIGYTVGGKERRLTGSERYRDWTIMALARDMPYDEMIRHQLVADRTDPNNENGNLDAMGFLTIGRRFLNKLDIVDDRIDVISRGLLGMTVTCARCHDHKFDPIPAADYYSLYGILQSSRVPEDGPSPLAMVDIDKPHDHRILLRGQPGNNGDVAPRQYLTALRQPDEPKFEDGSGRLQLANRIADASNPLTARVMVNRVWGILIGRPLVDSASDFGFRTEPPKIAAVLDNLAVDFATDWSIKRLVRRIVNTRIYRQSSAVDEQSVRLDPDNQYLARANRRRRDFESLRDSMLLTAHLLDRQVGGEPVEITSDQPAPRRTIYAMIDRQNLPAIFRTFDFASPDTHSPGRYYTTVPQQSLYLLNNEQVFALARSTTASVQVHGDANLESQSREMFVRVLRREPTADEQQAAVQFLRRPSVEPEPAIDPRATWSYAIVDVDDKLQTTATYPLDVFKDKRWQAEDTFPSKEFYGHGFLSNKSGHTPRKNSTATRRLWTAPVAGQVQVHGNVRHWNEAGDGIRAVYRISGVTRFDEQVHNSDRAIGPIEGSITAGQSVELLALPGDGDNSDSFEWTSTIRLLTTDGRQLEFDSVNEFSGPFRPESVQALNRLQQLAQVLLMSNEFAFVD